jgi:PAS domain S-box-containing protein
MSSAFSEAPALRDALLRLVGTPLDPAATAEAFVAPLLDRTPIDYAAVWMRPADGEPLRPLHVAPPSDAADAPPSPEHLLALLGEGDRGTLHAGDDAFKRLAADRPYDRGAVTALRLGPLGLVELHTPDRAGLPPALQEALGAAQDRLGPALANAREHQRLQDDLSNHRQVQAGLRRSRSRLSTLIQNLQDAIVVEDEDRNLILTNQAFCDLFEIPASPDDLVGADCAQAAESAKDLFADPDGFIQQIEDRLARRETVHDDVLRLADGRVLLRDFVPVRFDDGTYLGHLWRYRDVTESRHVREKLEYRLELERIIVDVSTNFIKTPGSALDGVIERALGVVGDFIGVDRSYVFTLDEEAETISNTHEWCAPSISSEKENLQDIPADQLPWWMDRMRRHQPLTLSSLDELPPEASTEREVLEAQSIQSLIVVPMRHQRDTLVGFVGFDAVRQQTEWDSETVLLLQVLSDAIANALHRRSVEKDLRRAKQKAEEASRAKSAFLANISHEIRTPLNGVIGMTSLLHETDLDEQQRQYVDTIQSSGDTLLTLINDVLDLSKIEAGQLDLEHAPFAVRDVVEDVVNLMAPQAHEKGLDLAYTVAPDVPARVQGDATRVRQILLNLCSNAVKFTEEGEVTIEVETESGDPPDTDAPVPLRFHVEDTGVGIAPDKQAHIFDPFTQADASMTREYGGTGLGLSITRKLAHEMDGSVRVESTPGEGSTFTVALSVSQAPQAAAPDEPAGPAGTGLDGRRVLLVGPDTATVRAVRRWGESWGLHVDRAPDVADALTQLADGTPSVDALLVDAPDADALSPSALRMLRAGSDSDSALLVFLPLDAEADGTDDASVLRKPISASRLYDALQDTFDVAVDAAPASPPVPDDAPDNAAPLRLLIVEDNAVNQRVLKQMLEQMGHAPDLADNGREAVEAVQERTYDLVFMDLQMPTLNGLDATRRIRALDDIDPPRIVALTAGAFEETREQCLAAGMDDYLAKPVRLEDLRPVLADTAPGSPAEAAPPPDHDTPVPDALDARALRSLVADVGADGLADPFVQNLLSQFLEEADASLRTMEAACAERDLEAVQETAHRLKGSARTIGALPLGEGARTIEEQAAAERIEALEQELEDLDAALARLRSAVDEVFAEQ